MDAEEARRRFSEARIARLATVSASSVPHLVPIVFAVVGNVIYSAVDSKPKKSTALRRFRNVRENPHVAVLVDSYTDDDWTALWWARADGIARVIENSPDDEMRHALDALRSRYPQYRERPPGAPVLAVDVRRWGGWSASESGGAG